MRYEEQTRNIVKVQLALLDRPKEFRDLHEDIYKDVEISTVVSNGVKCRQYIARSKKIEV